jgi:hypothetical protein
LSLPALHIEKSALKLPGSPLKMTNSGSLTLTLL